MSKPDPEPLSMAGLTDILFGHAAFQYLNAGCQLGVFEALASRPDQTLEELLAMLSLPYRSLVALLFGLKSLGLIVEADGRFRCAAIVEALFADGGWETIRHTVLFEAEIVYSGQADFVQSLK